MVKGPPRSYGDGMLLRTHAAGEPAAGVHAIHALRTPGIGLRVLGEVEVGGRDGLFAPAGARPGALLALLAIHAGECVAVDRIIDELWTTQAAPRDVKRVHVNVSRLRWAIARIAPDVDATTVVRTRRSGYALELDPDAVDAVRFTRLVARARQELAGGDPRHATVTLRSALALWRGEPYGDYAYEQFAAPEICRLEDLRSCAVELLAEAQLALGAHATMVAELERLIARHPLHERLYGLLMVALYRCGRQGDALEVYRAAHRTLVDALGIEPGPQLRRRHREILDQCPSLELAGDAADAGRLVRGQAA